MRYVTICGECNSSNLGDAVIGDCIQYLFRRINPLLCMTKMDLSGRVDAMQSSRYKKTIHALNKNRLINKSLAWIKWNLKTKNYLQNYYKEFMRGTDYLIIGGGHLLQDNGLNFPLKINLLTSCANEHMVPYGFFSCGVGKSWSIVADNLFKSCLSNARLISVRDSESKKLLEHKVITTIDITSDPAIWASNAYGINKSESRIIGIGVTHPNVLARHSDNPEQFSKEKVIKFWKELIIRLSVENYEFRLFTNGAIEDEIFIKELANYFDYSYDIRPLISPRPTTAYELVETISKFNLVIAHRLHSSIIAFSMGIPSIGLKWDSKIKWFYNNIKSPDQCIETGSDIEFIIKKIYLLSKKQQDSQMLNVLQENSIEYVRKILEKGKLL